MKGIELSRAFFEQYGRKMIENEFSEYADRIAAGLVGQGSERYGFDDEISRDHDNCAGFCLWISKEDDEKFGFELARAYRHLAGEYMGVSTKENMRCSLSKYGVITYDDFFVPLVGENYKNLSPLDFLYTPSNYLADASNGEVFFDGNGEFSRIREQIKNGMPEDIRLKKLAAALAGMAQSGQYNYARILSHGENAAAVLALCEFVKYTCFAVFLINRQHAPYYKWTLRALTGLKVLGNLAPSLEYLLLSENESDSSHKLKSDIIEDICAFVADELKKQALSDSSSDFMEEHARSVMNRIHSADIRNLHIMTGAL